MRADQEISATENSEQGRSGRGNILNNLILMVAKLINFKYVLLWELYILKKDKA